MPYIGIELADLPATGTPAERDLVWLCETILHEKNAQSVPLDLQVIARELLTRHQARKP